MKNFTRYLGLSRFLVLKKKKKKKFFNHKMNLEFKLSIGFSPLHVFFLPFKWTWEENLEILWKKFSFFPFSFFSTYQAKKLETVYIP